ncbi:uncharacterized protein CLAFUR5_13073 [Fulvia fulva]|uniref:Uncharacterized protein n=1 Tax=Passalora fulva TaxID=5499 RepID=A0A9Q8PJA2_PASFU|nr:uncharacterized protein CLAFUR5_13073 [Fulvia fulva]KAK4612518.1 hypothetical protein CLAFUR0_13227 [Fulvia fulva]UJO23669.1 hypothetical protein CLAFUR5_13073 [Fulvia fulva]
MQHGPLTPLGRQLRSVRATITAKSPINNNRHGLPLPPRTFVSSLPSSSRQKSATKPDPDGHDTQPFTPFADTKPSTESEAAVQVRWSGPNEYDAGHFTESSPPRFRGRARTDHLTEALQETAQLPPHASNRRRKPDHSYVDPQSRAPTQDYGPWADQDKLAEAQRHARLHDVSVQRILADFIRHKPRSLDSVPAEWEPPFALAPLHARFLARKGLTLQDIEALADIVTTQNSFDAAQKLARYSESRGSNYFPIFVYLNLLKRSYIGARALRTFINLATIMFKERAQSVPHPDYDRHAILLAVIRLLRHAREVWPQSMRATVELMLHHLAYRETLQPYDREGLSTVTYELNKIMGLVSYATAIQPFKDNPHQEAAIVPILRYMAEHDPPLHIDRQGYRAVIRIQLSQRKTPNEIQWAELKALSWPPWKVDRTAMDASIDAEYGTSRAGATLTRMKEAGYRPLQWERTAQLYTGWDPDGTPTIQMRALHEQPGARMSTRYLRDEQGWPAKISSTRTIQEAWACYLAWEDQKLPHDQAVYLAILTRLRDEENRSYRAGRHRNHYSRHIRSDKAWPLLPGDTVEIAPLPPSTHLYTYTRTKPPTVDEFYRTLTSQKVTFKGHCLAFLIQHAATVQEAAQRIEDASSTYPDITGVLVPNIIRDITKIPPAIYGAIVKVFARFGRVPLWRASAEPDWGLSSSLAKENARAIHGRLNPTLFMTRALELLRDRPVLHRRLWSVLLEGLTNKKNRVAMSRAWLPRAKLLTRLQSVDIKESADQKSRGDHWVPSKLPIEIEHHACAINAYRIARRLLVLMRENHLDPDVLAFRSFCLTTENMVIAAWAILQKSVLDDAAGVVCDRPFNVLREDMRVLLRKRPSNRPSHQNRLKGEFGALVGQDETLSPAVTDAQEATLAANVPRLLVVPSAAILHGYVRTLGWFADYDGLLTTVRWMRDNWKELAERQSHDRNGTAMMRKVIVALRVFLERSWLANSTKQKEVVDAEFPNSRPSILAALRSPAETELIDAVRGVVEEVEEWEGWPTDAEVEEYAADTRFDPTKLPSSESELVFIDYRLAHDVAKKHHHRDPFSPRA